MKAYDEALERLDAAAKIAETPDEKEQLLRDRIATYSGAGTHDEPNRVAPRGRSDGREFASTYALMYAAVGRLTDAYASIQEAVRKAPEATEVRLIAAEIAERQNRLLEASIQFRKLADVDSRYRTNHLKRVADLQIRLGQVNAAMMTCDELIDANPASPESYQFLARLAFRSGREDQGVAALRRAMNVAPRDNSSRRMLAAAFAERFRTDEAIELYWQAMRYENGVDERVRLVKELAPLYDRKNEIGELVRRIERDGE